MQALAVVDGARLVSFATGRGGVPTGQEWLVVLPALLLFALVVGRLLVTFGLTRLEAGLVSAAAPLTVLFDVPLGVVGPLGAETALAANVAGALIPFLICVKVLAEGRIPGGMLLFLIGVATLVSYASSEVVPGRGVLLHYRLPAFAVGLLAGVLWYRHGVAAGAAGYAAGAAGVIIGADLVRITDLAATGNASRIVLGGAGLLDGIYLVAFLSAGIAASVAVLMRWFMDLRAPRRASAG